MKQHHINKQQGATMMLTLVFMIGMLGIIGFAIDTGHILVNKTRLQNALDATALSAAITLNGPSNNSKAESVAAGIETFEAFKALQGNNELAGVTLTEANFLFSDNVSQFLSGVGGTPNFVRVSSNALQVNSFFIQVITKNASESVGAISTAGPMGENCNIVPFVLCAGDLDPDTENIQMDKNCQDDTNGDGFKDCYGYNLNEEFGIHKREDCSKVPAAEYDACIATNVEAGNFELLAVADSASGSDIRDSIAGEIDACTASEAELGLAPGFKVGPVSQGIDLRISRDTVTTAYSAEEYFNPLHNAEDAYIEDQKTPDNLGGIKDLRIMAIPIGNCDDIQAGRTSIKAATDTEESVARMCVLAKRPPEKPPENTIFIEILETCSGFGKTDPNNPVIYGPFKIVLFKSENSKDS